MSAPQGRQTKGKRQNERRYGTIVINGWIAALPVLIGFCMDAVIGDPYTVPHPVRAIGKMISALEKRLRKEPGTIKEPEGVRQETPDGKAPAEQQAAVMKKSDAAEEPVLPEEKAQAKRERREGIVLVILVLLVSTALPCLLLAVCYRLHVVLGIAAESILCCYMLAARCLRDESMKVYRALGEGDLEKARYAVSMIVGRDTEPLDAAGIARAAVETVAESTCDGVAAPLFYMAFGGAAAAFFYKAANTMDSMIGYKNARYRNFGRAAARLDDILNYIPSRLTAVCMIAAAYLCRLDGRNAWRIWRRDRRKHASPNAAQTESVCAGALGLQLAGDAYYGGRLLHKPAIGDARRAVEPEDIRRANRLMYTAAGIMLALALAVRAALF